MSNDTPRKDFGLTPEQIKRVMQPPTGLEGSPFAHRDVDSNIFPTPEELEKANPHFAHIQEMGRQSIALNDRGLYYVLFDGQEYLGQWRADQGGFLFFPSDQGNNDLECEFEAPGDLCAIVGPMTEIERFRVLDDAIRHVTTMKATETKVLPAEINSHRDPSLADLPEREEEMVPKSTVIELLNYLANQ